jgi:hypothetical protein
MKLRLYLIALAWLALTPPMASGGGLELDTLGSDEDGFLKELTSKKDLDYDLLRVSHLSEVSRWTGVRPPSGAEADAKYSWAHQGSAGFAGRSFVGPVSEDPIATLIAVPEGGKYHIWLCYVASRERPRPVTLRLTGANVAEHVFGNLTLTGDDGAAMEKRMPIRFESDRDRINAALNATCVVWERWDVELKAGNTVFSLSAKDKAVRVDDLFITMSKDFSPSKDVLHGNLNRTYYRYRVAEAESSAQDVSVEEELTYHWRHIPKGYEEPLWYSSLGAWEPDHVKGPITSEDGQARTAVGKWTRWVDATEGIRAPGTYATGRVRWGGIRSGVAEIQLAWFTHPGAVLKTIRPLIGDGCAVYMIPLDSRSYTPPVAPPDAKEGAWGMRTKSYLDRLETPADIHMQHLQWTQQAIEKLGEGAKQPTPRMLRLFTGFNPAPGDRDAAARMLVTLGINSLGGVPPDLRDKYNLRPDRTIYYLDALFHAGTHCPTDPLIEPNFTAIFEASARSMDRAEPGARQHVVRMKMGDEIGAITSAEHVNKCSDCLAAFHDYLRRELTAMGETPAFFGVANVEDLPYLGGLPPDAGRFERRLYYHSEIFKFLLTASFYKRMTAAAENVFPNVKTYCNFSPHPPMFGGHMNGSDWFMLTREKGATAAWGEDWATSGSWGMAGIQTVSYYGAWVECAARKHNMPSGFYNVASCGAADRKMFSLIAHGIFEQHIYDWGPQYSWAEASNSWSESPGVYAEIARGTHALGAADELIVGGRREPRRVALLYNRTHEIWNEGYGGFQTDRLLAFLALQHAHIPVDIIIEDDLNPDDLKRYAVLYAQGFNLSKQHIAAIENWVKEGGVLYAVAGTAMRDRYNDPIDDGARLFGATQRIAGCSEGGWHAMAIPNHKPIDRLKLSASALTPEVELDVVGVKAVLTPTTGKATGTFADGSCGAVLHELGRGKTLLLGVTPGHIYAHNAPRQHGIPNTYKAEQREVITLAATRTLGRQRVEYSEPLTEICLFDHEKGIAVTLNDFSYAPGRDATLSVEARREVREVVSTTRGPLEWKKDGDRILIACPVPEAVDVVILR